MNQAGTKPWVLVSRIKEDAIVQDMEGVAPRVMALVDEWQARGRIMWSGAFDDNASSMAVFEGTDQEARSLFERYEDICSGALNCYLYQWDAMPVLSVLAGN